MDGTQTIPKTHLAAHHEGNYVGLKMPRDGSCPRVVPPYIALFLSFAVVRPILDIP